MFGGDPKILGRVIKLNGNPSTIVGVMPREFAMPDRADVWLPLSLDPAVFNCWCLDMVGRMKPGITADQAKRDLIATVDAFALSRRDVFPDANPADHAKIIVMPLVTRVAGDIRTPLLVLIAAVAVVLLIACANIANLLLARAAVRNRENGCPMLPWREPSPDRDAAADGECDAGRDGCCAGARLRRDRAQTPPTVARRADPANRPGAGRPDRRAVRGWCDRSLCAAVRAGPRPSCCTRRSPDQPEGRRARFRVRRRATREQCVRGRPVRAVAGAARRIRAASQELPATSLGRSGISRRECSRGETADAISAL